MAAVDPSKSLNREKTPTVEVGTSGEKGEAAESRCSVGREDDGTAGSPDGERRAEAAAARGADKTTCASPEDPTAAEKMAEAPGIRQRAYDWSGTEEDDDERAKTEENKRGVYFYQLARELTRALLLSDYHRDSTKRLGPSHFETHAFTLLTFSNVTQWRQITAGYELCPLGSGGFLQGVKTN